MRGAPELLAGLPAGSWGIVTSGHRALAQRRLRAVGLPVPAAMVCGDEVAKGKPDPEGFLTGARLLGARARGVRRRSRTPPPASSAARAAGMRVVGITTTHRAAALAGADAVIADLHGVRRPLSRRSGAPLPASRARGPGRLRPRMDLAITIGQGLGFGVACGLSTIALLVPLLWPGIDARALGALGAPGLVLAAVDVWTAAERAHGSAHRRGRRRLRVLAARRPRLGGPRHRRGRPPRVMAVAAVPLAESAARAGSRPATALIAAVAALIVAAAALVPFVGYPLALVAIFLALRTRRRGGERYQGLRILR